MPKLVLACAFVCVVAAMSGVSARPGFTPAAVAAETAATTVDASLLDAPDPGAAAIATLPWGTPVSIDGEPVAGYYPVSAEGLSGWLPGEVLEIAKDAPAESVDAGAAPAGTGDVSPEDRAPSETAGATAAAPAASDPAPAAPAAAEPAAEPAAPATADPASGPTGPADVVAEAPVYGGPGPEYGLIATAPVGSSVEQTGHVVDGYVTVKFAGITGWAPLDHLGVPGSAPEPTSVDAPPDQTDESAPRAAKERRGSEKDKGRRR
jgi:hypothetical protein